MQEQQPNDLDFRFSFVIQKFHAVVYLPDYFQSVFNKILLFFFYDAHIARDH